MTLTEIIFLFGNAFIGGFIITFGIIAFLAISSYVLEVIMMTFNLTFAQNKAVTFTEDEMGLGYFSAYKKLYKDEMQIYDHATASPIVLPENGFSLDDLLTPDGEIPDKFLGERHDS